jgi:DNA (cytosine-5)-methyltransferase 1
MPRRSQQPIKFVDAFAGCGGLSLGLLQAGLRGAFAIERDRFAFATLKENLIDSHAKYKFTWPKWLPKEPISIEQLIGSHEQHLKDLEGSIGLLAGGPPCQGFSSAGRRRHDDPRNQMFARYVELVELLKPQALLIENVRGFTVDFRGKSKIDNYAGRLRELLSDRYEVHEELLNLADFGVPQSRTRYVLLAFEPGVLPGNPFDLLRERLPSFLRRMGLQVPVASRAALSDLELSRAGTRPSVDTDGFIEIQYKGPQTRYQKLMNSGPTYPTDLRLARHAPEIAARFAEIIELSHAEGRLNTSISEEMRQRYGLRKRAIRVLDPDRPAPTVTSMPDDLLHYAEPRTLTVRENARLQGFPDWFAFHGKYTTGGHLRQKEVPRFTQVANAVPPLAAQAIGEMIIDILSAKRSHNQRHRRTGRLPATKRPLQATEVTA